MWLLLDKLGKLRRLFINFSSTGDDTHHVFSVVASASAAAAFCRSASYPCFLAYEDCS